MARGKVTLRQSPVPASGASRQGRGMPVAFEPQEAVMLIMTFATKSLSSVSVVATRVAARGFTSIVSLVKALIHRREVLRLGELDERSRRVLARRSLRHSGPALQCPLRRRGDPARDRPSTGRDGAAGHQACRGQDRPSPLIQASRRPGAGQQFGCVQRLTPWGCTFLWAEASCFRPFLRLVPRRHGVANPHEIGASGAWWPAGVPRQGQFSADYPEIAESGPAS